jgi:hypothetical protein
MNDMADAQLRNGLVPNIAPEYTVRFGTFPRCRRMGSRVHHCSRVTAFSSRPMYLRAIPAMKRYFAYSVHRHQRHRPAGDWYDLCRSHSGSGAAYNAAGDRQRSIYDASTLRVAEVLGNLTMRRTTPAGLNGFGPWHRAFFHEDIGSYATGGRVQRSLPVLGMVDRTTNARAALVADTLRVATTALLPATSAFVSSSGIGGGRRWM